ncbi:MAG: SAM-dependent methyltransferase [Clostridiaceae bacterium]|nr:SAM-dependent methyltransferase [Clostridiaceae bacterium]
MPIPEAFIEEMKLLWQNYDLPGSFASFFDSLDQPQVRGIRANGLKIDPQKLSEHLADIILAYDQAKQSPRMVPWNDDGFYIQTDAAAGRLPAYHAGLFYIQEPSAMLPAKVLAAKPGEKILDLCAAPGGKTARIAADLAGQGLLWANEISADRARALLRNIELMGCKNCIISQETPERLADMLSGFFDRILVDAPCSGSGMFRRDNQAAASWEKFGVEHCTLLQQDILTAADKMLRPGGWLVYSTCSFSVAEDEAMISKFMLDHPEYILVEIQGPGLSPGIKYDGDEQLAGTARIWPHVADDDGHFCALLQKCDQAEFELTDYDTGRSINSETRAATEHWLKWSEKILSQKGQEEMKLLMEEWQPRLHNNHLQLLPPETPAFAGLKMVKTGFYLGHFKISGRPDDRTRKNTGPNKSKNKLIFEPAHAWFTSMHADDFAYTLKLAANDEILLRYLRGETIAVDTEDISVQAQKQPQSGDHIVICLEDYPLGYAKMQQGTLKNMYPAAWRLRT